MSLIEYIIAAVIFIIAFGLSFQYSRNSILPGSPATITGTGPTVTNSPFAPSPTLGSAPTATPALRISPPTFTGTGIWLSKEDIAKLPTSGAGWDRLLNWANQDASNPNIKSIDDDADSKTVAKALVYARTGNSTYRSQVASTIRAVMNTQFSSGDQILARNRNIGAYAVAADLISLSIFDPSLDNSFRTWLRKVLDEPGTSAAGGVNSVRDSMMKVPTNGGNHARSTVIAIALYLGDTTLLQTTANRFQDWLGRSASGFGWDQGSGASWQSEGSVANFNGINPVGGTIQGHNVSGVLPEDQKRGGSFSWPPPKEGYVYEGLQGVLSAAWMLYRQGYPAFEWENQAIKRAFEWLNTAQFIPNNSQYLATDVGDGHQPWLVNYIYGTNFGGTDMSGAGKNGLGFYYWTHVR